MSHHRIARPGRGPGGAEVRIASRLLGDLVVAEDRVLVIADGIVGFPGRRAFARVPARPGSPFEHLVSLEDAELAFSVGDPRRLVPDYAPPLEEAAIALGARPEDVEILAFVVVPEDIADMTIDLGAPLAIDRARRIACQLLIVDPVPRPPVPLARSPRGR